MNGPESPAVDLDFVDDPSASTQDREDDAALASLVRSHLLAMELPPSGVRVHAVTRGASNYSTSWTRRRSTWWVAGAAAAASLVAVVVGAATVLGDGHAGPVVSVASDLRDPNGPRVLTAKDGSLLLVSTVQEAGGMQALGEGKLARTSEGCLGWTHGGNTFQMVVWPFGTNWDPTLEVLSVPGEGDFHLGQEMQLGGGEAYPSVASESLPANCVQQNIWAVFTNLTAGDS